MRKTCPDLTEQDVLPLGKDEPEFVKKAYIPVLRGQLLFHARVLEVMQNNAVAQAKPDEAASL